MSPRQLLADRIRAAATTAAMPLPALVPAREVPTDPVVSADWRVLGDHLVDHGDVRGKIIDLTGRSGTPPERRRWLAEVRREVAAHRTTWLAGLTVPTGVRLRWQHGFVVGVDVTRWGPEARQLLDALGDHPVAAPWWSLRLTGVSDADLTDLSGLAPLHRPTTLHLSGRPLSDEGIVALAGSETFPNLAALEVWRCALGPAGAHALVRSPVTGGVTSLRIPGCRFEDEVGEILIQGPLPNLEILDLSHNSLTRRATVPFGNPNGPDLVHLDLSGNPIDCEGAVALARGRHPKLTGLDLTACGVGPRGAMALAGSEGLSRMSVLRLEGNHVGAEGAVALARPRFGRSLVALGLSHNAVGDEGALALGETDALPNLEALELMGSDIGPDGATALARSTSLRRLRSLNLGNNPIGNAGIAALARAAAWPQLRTLWVNGSGIDGEGVAALIRGAALPALAELDLSQNTIDDAAALALIDTLSFPALVHVSVVDTSILDEGALHLAGTRVGIRVSAYRTT